MKFNRIITIIFTVLAAGMAVLSGVMKLTAYAEGIKALETVGVAQYRVWLGLAEIIFAALFIYSKTMRLGFILLSCYFAGALATELSHQLPANALLPVILVWIAALLRDRSIFLGRTVPAGT